MDVSQLSQGTAGLSQRSSPARTPLGVLALNAIPHDGQGHGGKMSFVAGEANFRKLRAYGERDCLVPRNTDLGTSEQSQGFKKTKLSATDRARFRRMHALGFVGEKRQAFWEANFQKLVAFKDENGHCNVPRKYPTDQQLGTWVNTQRRTYTKKPVTDWTETELDRFGRLYDLGFDWAPSKSGRGGATDPNERAVAEPTDGEFFLAGFATVSA